MPPRLLRAHSAIVQQPYTQSIFSPFACPACLSSTLSASVRPGQSRRLLGDRKSLTSTRRTISYANTRISVLQRNTARTSYKNNRKAHVTTLASNTAINAPKNVPQDNRELYSSLQSLTASDHVNQSRLQLALRSLESAHPVIRVGIFGLGNDGQGAARRLARVLLADPLGNKEAWEDRLAAATQSEGKALLLKYGSEEDAMPHNPLMDVLSAPSRVLQRNNLEVLIMTLNPHAAPVTDISEAVLVPPLQTPIAATGRAGFVRYPVHKALLVGEGVTGCIDVGRITDLLEKDTKRQDSEDLIRTCVDLPYAKQDKTRTQTIDIENANAALDLFREDVSNGPVFSEKWQASGMPGLTQWLASQQHDTGTNTTTVQAKAVVKAHISSLINDTKLALQISETASQEAIGTQTIPESTRARLQTTLSSWAQYAHTDLQHSLERAFSSRSWRRTSWLRLLWRVDDVGVSAEDVLRSHWLLHAESSLAFVAGRVEEAGFFRNSRLSSHDIYNPNPASEGGDMPRRPQRIATVSKEPLEAQDPTTPQLLRSHELETRLEREGGINVFDSRPWPLAIHFTRQKLLHTIVPALQSRAQTLILQYLTTVGATSALGVWFYVATASVGIYEAGAIAALGLVLSSRRLQAKWERERERFAGEVMENGRLVLAEVEGTVRGVVRDNERPVLRQEDLQGRNDARQAIKKSEKDLEKYR